MSKIERDRIKEVYLARAQGGAVRRYSLFAPGELYMAQRREEEILRVLARHGCNDLRNVRLLEVGCGRGLPLVDWCRWGATPALLHGIDLLEPFVAQARDLLPGANLIVGTADRLPYRDHAFDIVVQLTVFTSILNDEVKRAIAAEMCRVTAPGGLILWYDFRYPSPHNPNVWAIGRNELRALFPGWSIDLRSLTLLPPLTRRLARVSIGACRLLEWALPPLRSHYLAVLRPPSPEPAGRTK